MMDPARVSQYARRLSLRMTPACYIAIALAALLLLGGEARAQSDSASLIVKKDDFEGTTVKYTRDIPVGGAESYDARVHLILEQTTRKDGAISYRIIPKYEWSTWMFISPGPSLVFLLDGRRVEFTGPGSQSNRITIGRGVMEMAPYEITPKQLAELAAAKAARFKVSGSRLDMERSFTDDTFAQLRAFNAAMGIAPK